MCVRVCVCACVFAHNKMPRCFLCLFPCVSLPGLLIDKQWCTHDHTPEHYQMRIRFQNIFQAHRTSINAQELRVSLWISPRSPFLRQRRSHLLPARISARRGCPTVHSWAYWPTHHGTSVGQPHPVYLRAHFFCSELKQSFCALVKNGTISTELRSASAHGHTLLGSMGRSAQYHTSSMREMICVLNGHCGWQGRSTAGGLAINDRLLDPNTCY